MNLGLTPTTTEGLLSTVEVHNNNLEGEGKEIPEDDLEHSSKERPSASSSSYSNNDDDESSSASNDATQSSYDAAQLLLASLTKDAASVHTAPEKVVSIARRR